MSGSRRGARLRAAVVAASVFIAGSATGQAPVGGAGRGGPAGGDALATALEDLERSTQSRARVETEIEALIGERDGAQRRLRGRVRTLYRLRRAGVLPLAGGIDVLLRHQSRVTRLERMVARDVESLGTLRRRVSLLSSETARLADAVRAAEQRASALRDRQSAQQRDLAILSGMIEDPGAWSGPSASGFGVRLSDAAPASVFLSRRGELPLPVAGSARVSDGTREGGEGLELVASPGVSVRSVEEGRVAYAAAHPAYRRLVIVDHGDDHFTVYGGLASIAVGVGQPVARDAVLGAVGDEPVFFQVRRGSRPLAARAWLGI